MPQIGGSIFLHMPAMLLMPYLTNAVGVAAGVAGAVIFVPKIWVIFSDPMSGLLTDKARDDGLARSRVVFWAGLGMAVALPLVFAHVELGSPAANAAYVLVAYLVASTIFSAFSVPYLGLASEIARDEGDRARLLAWRQAANFAGALLANYAPAAVLLLGTGRSGYAWMAAGFGVICAITIPWIGGTGQACDQREESERTSLTIATIGAVFADARFRTLLITYALQMAAVGVISASFLYFILYRLGGDLLQVSLIATLMTFIGLVAQPLWVRCQLAIGPLKSYALCIIGMAAGDGSFFLLGPGQFMAAMVCAAFVGLFASGYPVMAWTLLLDLLDGAEKAGQRSQVGGFAGIWSATEKVAIASGALIGGFALQVSGFASSEHGFIAQSAGAILGIRIVASGLTATLLCVSLIPLAMLCRPHRLQFVR